MLKSGSYIDSDKSFISRHPKKIDSYILVAKYKQCRNMRILYLFRQHKFGFRGG